jgi:hypothetical protein
MKKIQVLGLFLMMSAPVVSIAQDCKSALPFTTGAQFEMKTFNEKDKLQSVNKSKVTDRKENGAAVEATISAESFDEKGKAQGSSTYTIKCENGMFMIDMKSMIDQKVMASYKDAEITIQADHLEMPFSPTVGQSLKDGSLTMTINPSSPMPMKNTISITNRKVEAMETITTPAGTFQCVKISYDVETKIMVKIRSRVEEWYAKEVGTVQSKSYDSRGKMQGYTQLTSMQK